MQQSRIDRRLEAIESSVSYLAEIPLVFLLEDRGVIIFALKREHQFGNIFLKGRVTKTQHKCTHTEEIALELSYLLFEYSVASSPPVYDTSLDLNFGKLKVVGIKLEHRRLDTCVFPPQHFPLGTNLQENCLLY